MHLWGLLSILALAHPFHTTQRTQNTQFELEMGVAIGIALCLLYFAATYARMNMTVRTVVCGMCKRSSRLLLSCPHAASQCACCASARRSLPSTHPRNSLPSHTGIHGGALAQRCRAHVSRAPGARRLPGPLPGGGAQRLHLLWVCSAAHRAGGRQTVCVIPCVCRAVRLSGYIFFGSTALLSERVRGSVFVCDLYCVQSRRCVWLSGYISFGSAVLLSER